MRTIRAHVTDWRAPEFPKESCAPRTCLVNATLWPAAVSCAGSRLAGLLTPVKFSACCGSSLPGALAFLLTLGAKIARRFLAGCVCGGLSLELGAQDPSGPLPLRIIGLGTRRPNEHKDQARKQHFEHRQICLACLFQFIAPQPVEGGKSLIRRRQLDNERRDRSLPQDRLPASGSPDIGCLASKTF